MDVCILGGGMSGLIAAKAIKDDNPTNHITILDKKINFDKSGIKGVHYLHGDCGMQLKFHTLLNFVAEPMNKTECISAQYGRKVWGDNSVLNNSLVNLPDAVTIYNFEQAFEILTKEFAGCIKQTDIDKNLVRKLQLGYDLIISTIPLQVLFPDVVCDYESVFAKECLPPGVELQDFTVLYNVDNGTPWYRCSKVFGKSYTECVNHFPGSSMIIKIKTQIQLNPDIVLNKYNILLAGRFGSWDRKKLVHNVYDDVTAAIKTLNPRTVNLL